MLGALPDGREILVHCPDSYNILEIEDLESGQRLTEGVREPIDVFHSRLSVSPDGRHLLMAGWVWHPYGVGWVFDIQQVLTDPSALDGQGIVPLCQAVNAEIESACWLDSDRVVMAATAEEPLNEEESGVLTSGQIGVWSIAATQWLHRTAIDYPIGSMIARGNAVIALHGHSRLVDQTTGAVVAEWPDINASMESGSYGVTHIPTTVAALHPDGTRLAIAQPAGIAILHLPDS